MTFALAPGQALPPGLTLTSGGLLSGTPTGSGPSFFSVTATDTTANFSTRTINVSIYPVGEHRPVGFTMSNTTRTLGTWTTSWSAGAVTGGVRPSTFSLTPNADLPALGATQVPGMRVLTGPPFVGATGTTIGAYVGVITTPGVYTPAIRITDTSDNSYFDRVFTVTVNSLTQLSQNNPPKATVSVPYSFTVQPSGSGGPYSWSATGLPSGLSINASSGVISGPPRLGRPRLRRIRRRSR